MHPNPAFRKTGEETNIAFARNKGFGVLAVNAASGPLLSHIPFQLTEDGSYLEAHLVRSNPIIRLLEAPVEAVIAVSSADAYVSPDWYGIKDQVPTWNYVAIHIRGKLERLDDAELHGVLERLTAAMENQLLPKKPWTSGKMDQQVYERMRRQIVPVAMRVEAIEGTWKLSQNKADEVRLAAAEGVTGHGIGTQTGLMADLMRQALS